MSLSNDNDDDNENVAKKLNWCPFKPYRVYFDQVSFVKCGRSFLELNSYGIYPCSKRERKIRRRMFTSSIKHRISLRRFQNVVVVQ